MRFVRQHLVYVAIVLGWLLLAVSALGFYANYAISQSQLSHQRLHQALQDRLWYQFAGADTALETFAAFQSNPQTRSFELDRLYARKLLARYPHLYSLQLIRRVPAGELERFTQAMRLLGNPGFTVHAFSDNGARQIEPLPKRDDYYPIVFMEPMRPGSEQILGLDVDFNRFLRSPRRSGTSDAPVATEPFRLVEGDWAYGMTRPAGFEQLGIDRHTANPARFYVGVVIKTSSLEPDPRLLPPGLRIVVHYADNEAAKLFELDHQPRSPLEQRWLPRLTLTSRIPSASQPYVLKTQWQLGWENFDPPTFGILLATLLPLLLALVGIAKLLHARRRTLQREADKLAHLAAHDPLTGLANRRSLDMALERHVADGTPCALIFLDLDRFKPINDEYGHDTGDYVLKKVAERLSRHVRVNDTLARWGGDEFALLLPGELSAERETEILDRMRRAMLTPISWEGNSLQVGASYGVARYPEDGATEQAVLQAADQRMYEQKQTRRGDAPGSNER
ncbi:sensor domain-containing diguanylate cyclase [Andreprevotia chitinilytica]|uniref:sensor domain-containing diguanylate cyclase n=1 Tax=Andreprevotia chitinilytica TaxID=396808 RepID=UPI000556CA5C|nr:diguanylate cyclase [Andreprevotia chitinilytica]